MSLLYNSFLFAMSRLLRIGDMEGEHAPDEIEVGDDSQDADDRLLSLGHDCESKAEV